MKRRVLILCTGNSARSQMAEGLVNHLRCDRWEASSAGTHPTGYVHPNAVEVMAELGIDLSAARSKSADEFRNCAFDVVLTVCDDRKNVLFGLDKVSACTLASPTPRKVRSNNSARFATRFAAR